jgi:hypothetical protein
MSKVHVLGEPIAYAVIQEQYSPIFTDREQILDNDRLPHFPTEVRLRVDLDRLADEGQALAQPFLGRGVAGQGSPCVAMNKKRAEVGVGRIELSPL